MKLDQVLGTGLVTPLRRQGGDFTYASGVELMESVVRQILMTRKGDLRWRPNFGTTFDRRRHRRIDEAFLASLQADAISALAVDPRIQVLDVEAVQPDRLGTTVLVRIRWRAVTQGSERSTVLTEEQQTEVRI